MRSPTAKAPRGGEAAARITLHAAGLRATPQRLAVLAVAARAGGAHLSAEDVWRRLRQGGGEMDRSTVYRVLADLTEAGLLEQVRLGDDIARFEIQDVAHHHAVCTLCGATEDVSVEAVHALASRLRRDTGFALGHHPLLLPGLCARCAAPRD
ncbi:MAG: Fur family transcriptional regulator [Candidatus Dormibacteria bacterium]